MQCVITPEEPDPVSTRTLVVSSCGMERTTQCFPFDLTAIKMSPTLNHDILWRIYKWDDTGLQPAGLPVLH